MVTATVEKPIQKAVEKAKEAIEQRKHKAKELSERIGRHSPSIAIGLTLGSIVYSLILFVRKSKENAIFVGLWAPTILALGLFHALAGKKRE